MGRSYLIRKHCLISHLPCLSTPAWLTQRGGGTQTPGSGTGAANAVLGAADTHPAPCIETKCMFVVVHIQINDGQD